MQFMSGQCALLRRLLLVYGQKKTIGTTAAHIGNRAFVLFSGNYKYPYVRRLEKAVLSYVKKNPTFTGFIVSIVSRIFENNKHRYFRRRIHSNDWWISY